MPQKGADDYTVLTLFVKVVARAFGERGNRAVAKIIERVRARYEVEDVEMGKVYRWRPESVVVECGCGEKPTLTASKHACGQCGADHRTVVQDEVSGARLEDEDKVDRPWRSLRPYYAPTRGT